MCKLSGRVIVQVEGFGSYNDSGEREDEGEEEDEGTEVLLPDQKRRGCTGWWLQVEEVWAEGCQEQPPSKVSTIHIIFHELICVEVVIHD